MVLVTDDPRLTDLLPPLVREKLNAATTVRLKVVVFETPPPVPLTVMGYVPVGVEVRVVMVNVAEQVGLQLPGENEAVVPAGSPEMEKETV